MVTDEGMGKAMVSLWSHRGSPCPAEDMPSVQHGMGWGRWYGVRTPQQTPRSDQGGILAEAKGSHQNSMIRTKVVIMRYSIGI